jgi:hypothetical protein
MLQPLFIKVPVPGTKAKVKYHVPVPGMKFTEGETKRGWGDLPFKYFDGEKNERS